MTTTDRRILVVTFLILIGTVAVVSAFNLYAFRRIYRDGLLARCQGSAAALKGFIETNLQRGLSLDVLREVDGRCRQIVENDPDLAYCLVENEIGSVIFTSFNAFDVRARRFAIEVHQAASRTELPGFGPVSDVSLPIYGAGKRLAGQVHVGFREQVLQKHTGRLLGQSMVVLGGALLGAFALLAFVARRNLHRPIRLLRDVAREIAAGNFRMAVPSMPSRDFNELADALQDTAVSLERRDEGAARSYRELEGANHLLQQAYEQQEKTSSELARSQKMHRALFESASDAIIISDHEERILLFNRQAEEFFGISRDQALGSNLIEFMMRMRGNGRAQQLFYADLLEKGRMESEIRFVRPKDNASVIGWSCAAVVHERKGKFWVQVIIRDITREARLKENLEQSTRELKRLNQMKDSFLGMASHELKTPLTVIVGYSDLLLNEGSVTANDALCSMVRHIADAAERLTGIVHDMVDVSMLDSCRVPMDVCSLDINLLLRQIVTGAGNFLEQRRQEIHLQLQPQLPLIECDAGRLKQALGNLLGNAIKFTPDGGRITLQSRLMNQAGEQKMEILVADTGIGIADRDREHIFEKFYEAGGIEEHFTAKTAFNGKGTGLGLTIAKGIIEMHGGRIWVESPGYDPQRCPGSIFHVVLPLRQPSGRTTETGLSCD